MEPIEISTRDIGDALGAICMSLTAMIPPQARETFIRNLSVCATERQDAARPGACALLQSMIEAARMGAGVSGSSSEH